MRAISDSRLTSVAAGRASQPVTGAAKPQSFRNKTISRVMSKDADDTEEGMAGKRLPNVLG